MTGPSGFLLDTNIVLYATRPGHRVGEAIDTRFGLSASRFRPAISEITVAELLAFSRGWGETRRELLRAQIEKSLVILISQPDIHQRWAEISSALRSAGITIGQNDIWIAATASVAGLTLLTTDKDFLQMQRVVRFELCVLDARTGAPLT